MTVREEMVERAAEALAREVGEEHLFAPDADFPGQAQYDAVSRTGYRESARKALAAAFQHPDGRNALVELVAHALRDADAHAPSLWPSYIREAEVVAAALVGANASGSKRQPQEGER